MTRLHLALVGLLLIQSSYGYVTEISTPLPPTPSPWFECPSPEGVFPSPRSCSEFFLCTNDLAWEQMCPAGLYFNPQTGICDYPANVDCHITEAPSVPVKEDPNVNKALPTYQGTDLGIDVNYTCPSDYGVFPHHECRKYYDCQAGKAHLILCWYDYYFDLVYNGCNYPEMVDCTGRDVPDDKSTTTDAPTSTTPFPFTCPTATGFYAVPGECSGRYIVCVDSVAYIEVCPGNAIFNPETSLCDDPANVPCVPDTTLAPETTKAATSTVTPTISTTKPAPFTCPSPDGTFPSPTKCEDYYVCQAGTAILNHCPDGLYFNPTTQLCDWPQNVDCNVRTVKRHIQVRVPALPKSQGTDLGIDVNYTCPAAWGVYPHRQCRQYYDCQAGDAHVMLCPNDWLFDLVYNGCNYPQYTECGDRIRPDNETTTTTTLKPTVGPDYECPPENGFYGAGNCSSNYYVCVDGQAFTDACPGSAIFDPVTGHCEDWQNVEGCVTSPNPSTTSNPDTTTSTTTKKPTTSHSSGFTCPSPNGMFADPNTCTGYYVCQSSYPTHMECSPGLYFNPLGYCDWPSNVPCTEHKRSKFFSYVRVKEEQAEQETTSPEPEVLTTEMEVTSVVPTGTGSTSITPAWWFECPGTGNYPDPEDCSAYFTCVNGLAWLEKCPSGTKYDAEAGACLVSSQTNCVPTTNYPHTSPTKAPNVTADPNYECPAANGMFANPLDCGTFYWCVENVYYFMHCPANTEFNADLSQCVNPSESNCTINTVIPTTATVFKQVKGKVMAHRRMAVPRRGIQNRRTI